MRFNFSALYLLALAVSTFCVPTGLITVEKVNGRTSGKYIVTLKNDVNKADLISQAKTFNVTHNWDIINGFAGHCDDATLDYLRAHSDVESIAEDAIATLNNVLTQSNAPWGLQRISQSNAVVSKALPSSLTFSYTYDSSAGKGVDIYIVDSGIYTGHSSFQGRARWGATFGGYPNGDGNGHGTHCAGTAASYNYGVAKAANLIAVKTFADNGDGKTSDIISGMNWIQRQASSSHRPSVVSLSFTSPPATALDNTVTSLTSKGIHVVVAAGNKGIDASNFSPCRAPSALTVGASDISDNFATFSNYGASVKLIAPGVDVTSAWIGSPTASETLSGTSMSAPHVAGLLAYFIGLSGDVSPEDLTVHLQDHAVRNALHNILVGTHDVLAQNMY